eukprot:11216573-Lingulodinium_polyedra.AAC.1
MPQHAPMEVDQSHAMLDSTAACTRCGKTGHSTQQCRLRRVTCNGCGKLGHIRAVCRNAGDKTASQPS